MTTKSPRKAASTLVTKAEYARLRDIDASLLSRRVASGLIQVEGPEELIDVDKVDSALKDALGTASKKTTRRGSKAARPGSGRRSEGREDGGLTLHEARTRRAREDAERAAIAKQREAMELRRLKGELVEPEQMLALVRQDYTALRASLLAVPSKWAAVLDPTNPRRANEILTTAIRQCLNDLVADAQHQLNEIEKEAKDGKDDA